MGIASGHKGFDMKDSQISPDSLGLRKFAGINLVKPKHLKSQLLKSSISSELQDIHDTVKIIILHVMSYVIFVTSSEVARCWMFRVWDNIEKLRVYNWGKAVIDYLMNFIEKKEAQDVKGCTTFLQVTTNI